MAYQWDDAKNKTNIEKHGVDFAKAVDFEWSEADTVADSRCDYDEVRFISTAPIADRLYVMVWTERETGLGVIKLTSADIRIISLRKANRREVQNYDK